jgi:RNA polymerase sigma-70 factor (ECF subfamily)
MSQSTVAAIETGLADESRAPAPASSASIDVILMERFQRGENAALVELFDRHNRRLSIYCQKLLVNREQAKDVAQELWERVLRLRGSGTRIDNPAGFFLKIARNLCLNHIASRHNHMPLASLREADHPVDQAGERSEMEELILASLDQLSFEHREVLVLHVYCGYRLEEIAAMVGKSPEAIWKRASRARKELRTLVMKGSDER